MKETWLVDGTNLLFCYARTQKKSPKPSHELFHHLADLATTRGSDVWVVLDGYGNKDEYRTLETKHLHIEFAGEIESDTWIERTLFKAVKREFHVVITNDQAICRMARGMGARTWSSEDLLQVLKEGRAGNKEIQLKMEIKAHRFNRPFDKKLKDKDEK